MIFIRCPLVSRFLHIRAKRSIITQVILWFFVTQYSRLCGEFADGFPRAFRMGFGNRRMYMEKPFGWASEFTQSALTERNTGGKASWG